MSWRPIKDDADLPPIGTDESESLDFKGEPWSPTDKDKGELLRDVSQFANHLGGSLIIGAAEDDSGRLREYLPLPDAEDVAARVRDLCYARLSPRIEVDCVALKAPNGADVLAVNVEASVGAVGIKFEDKWEFSRRYGKQKKPITFDEVERMWTEGRRGRILLSKIPNAGLADIHLDVVHEHAPSNHFTEASSNIARHEDYFLLTLPNKQRLNLPYEFVKAVWPRAGGGWCVALDVVLSRYGELWIIKHSR